jgi:hypothetical protein
MRIKKIQLDAETRDILSRSTIGGKTLLLPGQLERAVYQRVAKVIEAAGGKWSRKDGCHVFPDPVSETLDLSNDTVINVQQTYQSFYTPESLALRAAELCDLTAGDTLLEPSAGEGALIKAAVSMGVFRSDITAVEVQPRLATRLQPIAGRVVVGDFLQQNGALGLFNRVLMNPPFSQGDDIKHIERAVSYLAPGGRLVAICLNGPRQRQALDCACRWINLGPGAFDDTPVETALIVINKPVMGL